MWYQNHNTGKFNINIKLLFLKIYFQNCKNLLFLSEYTIFIKIYNFYENIIINYKDETFLFERCTKDHFPNMDDKTYT